ncbi:hypothetical protein Aduo_000485 [Ancylostoma duodenale]
MAILSRIGVILSVVWSLTATALMAYEIHKFTISHDETEEAKEEDNEEEDDESYDEGEPVSASEQIKFILSYCKDQWRWYLAGYGLMLVYIPAEAMLPAVDSHALATVYDRKGSYEVFIATLYRFGVCFIAGILGHLSGVCLERAEVSVDHKMRLDLFKSLVNKDVAFFDAHNSGELISRVTYDCNYVSYSVSRNLVTFVQRVIFILSALAFALHYSWRMTLLAIITKPLLLIYSEISANIIAKHYEPMQEEGEKTYQIVSDVLSTIKTVRSFACERYEINRFAAGVDKRLLFERKISRINILNNLTYYITYGLDHAALLLYGGHLILSERMSSSVLMTYLLYLGKLNHDIDSLRDTLMDIRQCIVSTKKVFTHIKNTSTHQNKGLEKPEIAGAVEMNSVNFAYPSRPTEEVLKNVNLKVKSGETVAFVGASGAGKSTIVSLMQQFYTPSSGSITIDGVSIQDIEHEYYHKKVSMVAQEPVLYDCSIRENILYGCDWATEEDMTTAAKMANAHDFIMQLDKGYKTKCGEWGAKLSGGQKQRIAIARALVRKPTVLILDEATSSLDSHSENAIQETLKRIAGELTVIVIAHRLSTIKHADRIYVVDNGSIVQSGTHTELLKDVDGHYFSLVSKQSNI